MADAHRKYNHINSLVINGGAVSNEESTNNEILSLKYVETQGKINLGM